MASQEEAELTLDQFDFDWESLNEYDQALDFNPASLRAEDFVLAITGHSSDVDSPCLGTRKHKLDKDLVGTSSESVTGTDGEIEEVAKAMKHGNFGRIIAESVVASGTSGNAAENVARPPLPALSLEERCAMRKQIVIKFMKCLNMSDMGTLAKVIRENCHEQVMFMSPDIRDPIYGKADMMILFSLMMEAYPDGVWKIVSTTNHEEDKVACRFSFRGTKVFPYPLETVLKQIKAHMNKDVYMSNSPAMASIQLVHDIAERVHPTVAERFHTQPTQDNRSSNSTSYDAEAAPRLFASELCADLSGDALVSLPQPGQLLRPTQQLETVVLKEGLVTYRRQTDFIFDEYDHIVRVISEDVNM